MIKKQASNRRIVGEEGKAKNRSDRRREEKSKGEVGRGDRRRALSNFKC